MLNKKEVQSKMIWKLSGKTKMLMIIILSLNSYECQGDDLKTNKKQHEAQKRHITGRFDLAPSPVLNLGKSQGVWIPLHIYRWCLLYLGLTLAWPGNGLALASGISWKEIILECQGSPTDPGVILLIVAAFTNGAEKEMLQVSTLLPLEETKLRSNSTLCFN